jgi:hypothetical protein
MWTVILILATGTQNVGQYSTVQACEAADLKFQQQKVVAACVPQETTEQSLVRMQAIMKTLIESMPK